ncbi:hypothetical protein FHS31_000863 [Sphingomonas vulcanisoli]|uniref:Helix-turn-helix domain-containing protein n=1 Tax=Sphingomonas vulcanisoli TaxID=1658060 RepID=A0ABX0TP08_9SPHN|nr:hypothetical protein [Sphingomonas vulcanisoli]NIJ07267.1 hypothetical protein [Sphingomonas vulcanisoli]
MTTIAIPMTGRSFGAIISKGDRPPTQIPVWANSYDVDDERCASFQHDVDKDELGPMLIEVERYARDTKMKGKRCGAIRTNGVAVLRYLYSEARRNGGMCCPSREQIAEAVRISRSCVEDTLRALRDCGFIEWLRRTVAGDGAGPDRVQTSNLYRFTMPKALAWRVSKYLTRRFGRRPGIPRSIAAALLPEHIAAKAERHAAERLMRRLRRATRTSPLRATPEPVERQV